MSTAAFNGNIELVKDHVVADAGCVLKAGSGYECLCFALPQPMQFGLSFLISVVSNCTPLICSSLYGHLDVTRFLVESGGNLEAKNNEYYTPTTLFFKSPASLYFGLIFLIVIR
jgi:hypothetical protein